MLNTDAHGIKYARDTFAEYGVELPAAAKDADVVDAYNSILHAAAIMARPSGNLFRALCSLQDFCAQPRLTKPIPDLNELLK